MLPQILRDVASLVYPPRCACCGESARFDSPSFCVECESKLAALSQEHACPRCAVPLTPGAACAHCNGKGFFPFETIVAFAPFRDPVRSLIHQMKFHHRWPVAEILADRAALLPRIAHLLETTDVLVPVPLHWGRQISRGYNQADAIARRLQSHRPAVKVCQALVRLKNTAAQTTIHSIADRGDNVRNAFGIADAKFVRGKRVTLVDDVTTTASTLKSAARVLQTLGPAELNAIVIAVADPRRRDFESA